MLVSKTKDRGLIPLTLAKLKQERNMLTRVLNSTKNEIKPTKKWDNEVIKMVERYDARKKIKEVSQRH